MYKLLIIAALIALVSCQKPAPCASPSQWAGRLFQYDTLEQFTLQGRYYYDDIYQRERIVEEYTLGSDKEAFDILYLHNQKIQYKYNFNTKDCTKTTIDRPWRKFAIPQNATSDGESYIGASGVANANLLLTLWEADFVDEKGNKWSYEGAWTYDSCLPVRSVYYNKQMGWLHSNFYDITPGIPDPTIWIPRKECQ